MTHVGLSRRKICCRPTTSYVYAADMNDCDQQLRRKFAATVGAGGAGGAGERGIEKGPNSSVSHMTNLRKIRKISAWLL